MSWHAASSISRRSCAACPIPPRAAPRSSWCRAAIFAEAWPYPPFRPPATEENPFGTTSVTGFDLDGDVRQRANAGETRLVGTGSVWPVSDQRDDDAEVTGPDSPQMQVGDAVAICLEGLSDAVRKLAIGQDIE